MMRKRITMETSKGCLGNLEHHEDFDPDKDQNGIDLYKGLDFYEKIIEKFTKITEERYELIETLREGMTKFGEDQGISDFYDQYKNLFKDAEFNLYDSSMDEYSESESDADNNNKNDVEEEKEKRYDIKCEELEYQATQDIKKKKTTKRKSPEDMTPQTFSLGLTPKESEPTEKEKEKQLKVESNVIDTFSLVLNHEQKKNSKGKRTKYFFHTTMITKDMSKWKKANGKYDEKKQFEAFSKKIKSEFKKEPEMKNIKDLEMAFFPIIAHEHYYLVVFNFLKGNTVIIDNSRTQMTYETKYKTKKLFSMHLEKVKHPRAKDVLNKKPTIIRPKWGTTENDTDYGIFLMMHMEHYSGETEKNWNLEFPTKKQGNTLDIIKMR
ncbi:ulp1 protease family, C-terminal catalytic domain-containing protein, partial [Tanacetum coccineum]